MSIPGLGDAGFGADGTLTSVMRPRPGQGLSNFNGLGHLRALGHLSQLRFQKVYLTRQEPETPVL